MQTSVAKEMMLHTPVVTYANGKKGGLCRGRAQLGHILHVHIARSELPFKWNKEKH